MAWHRLPAHAAAQLFEHEALVRGVLIDDDQPVVGLGNNIGARDLAARDAERVDVTLRHRRGRSLGSAHRQGIARRRKIDHTVAEQRMGGGIGVGAEQMRRGRVRIGQMRRE